MSLRVKRRIFEILEVVNPNDQASRFFYFAIISLIVLNVLAVVLETVEDCNTQYHTFFKIFEYVSVSIFTLEYFLRIWLCTTLETFKHPFWGRVKYIITPFALIDLMAILPFYLPFFITDLRILRSLRLLRLFRVLKLSRYSKSFRILVKVIWATKEELIITFFTVFLLLLLASSLIYFAEHDAQPEQFPNIPASMWWGVVTLTTVGYGDVYPVTFLGKLTGALVALLGIGIFALPAGILASGFSEEIQARKKNEKINNFTFVPIVAKILVTLLKLKIFVLTTQKRFIIKTNNLLILN